MIWKRIKNIWKLGEIEITSQKKEQIQSIINDTPRKAQIIKMKDEEKIINELLNENKNVETL